MSAEGDFSRLSKTGQLLVVVGYDSAFYGDGYFGGTMVTTDVVTEWVPIAAVPEAFTFLSPTGQEQIRSGFGLGGYGYDDYGSGDTLSVSLNTEIVTAWTPLTAR